MEFFPTCLRSVEEVHNRHSVNLDVELCIVAAPPREQYSDLKHHRHYTGLDKFYVVSSMTGQKRVAHKLLLKIDFEA